MTQKRILAIIIALSTLAIALTGCGSSSENYNSDAQATSSVFNTLTVETVGSYKQTLIYDTETMVEYVYLWHSGSGKTSSTMLYMPDGNPKLYSGQNSKLILISTENVGAYKLSLMYDSETLVMYSCSWHSGSGDTTIQALCNADGNFKLYQVSEKVPHWGTFSYCRFKKKL